MTTRTTSAKSRRHTTTRSSSTARKGRPARPASKTASPHTLRTGATHTTLRRATQPLAHIAGHVSLLVFLETIAKIILDKTPLLALLSLR